MSDAPFTSLLLEVSRVHHAFEDALGDRSLSGRFDTLTPAQALFLYKMGTDPVPFSELRTRGIHLGSNASHVVARLEAAKCLRRLDHPDDRRAALVQRTARGRDVALKVGDFLSTFQNTAKHRILGSPILCQRLLGECLEILRSLDA